MDLEKKQKVQASCSELDLVCNVNRSLLKGLKNLKIEIIIGANIDCPQIGFQAKVIRNQGDTIMEKEPPITEKPLSNKEVIKRFEEGFDSWLRPAHPTNEKSVRVDVDSFRVRIKKKEKE